jgi:hypothetical protein
MVSRSRALSCTNLGGSKKVRVPHLEQVFASDLFSFFQADVVILIVDPEPIISRPARSTAKTLPIDCLALETVYIAHLPQIGTAVAISR